MNDMYIRAIKIKDQHGPQPTQKVTEFKHLWKSHFKGATKWKIVVGRVNSIAVSVYFTDDPKLGCISAKAYVKECFGSEPRIEDIQRMKG
jgi:hypothetical protein